MDGPGRSAEDLERENRTLVRRLARLEANVRQVEELQDSTSTVLSGVMRELDDERARSHALLLNILPQPIIDRLDAGETTIADRFESVTVLFSDLVGFTSLSSDLEPDVLVTLLNRLFSDFDALCERTEVEKIKTIGDAYLAVGGLPGTRKDHAAAVAELALGMVEAVERLNEKTARPWRIRIGIHTGPAVAGVIGTRKFVYDVWGDTVNVASRLETSSEPNRIHVSSEVRDVLGDRFRFEPRGGVELKGKGEMATFLLEGPSA